jgi:trimeric autotransporter adhesin
MSTFTLNGDIVINYPVSVAPENSIFFGNGGQELEHNTGLEGWYNVGIGFRSLTHVTTGSYNTAGGFESLEDLTVGKYNTAFGEAAGIYLEDGDGNVLLGWKAGLGPVHDAHYNQETLVGFGAGMLDKTGFGNVGVGPYVMGGAEISGAHNVAVGREALYDLTSGSHNIAAGWKAGFNLTSGNNNLFLGVHAGIDVETGSYNVVIGNHPGLSATMNNVIIIADGAGVKRLVIEGNTMKFYATDGVTLLKQFP